jgi:RNA polymerase sigma factor (sigma-70 family)
MSPPVRPSSTTPPTDEELLEQYRKGSIDLAHLFPKLVDVYQPMLLLLARRAGFSADDAEDLVQDTFVRVYDYLRSHTVTDSLRPWMATVFRNIAFNRIRDAHAAKRSGVVVDESLLDLLPAAEPTAEESAMHYESVAAIREAFERALTPDEVRILLLRFVDEKALSEIARDLGITTSTLHYRYSIALRKLRDYLVMRETGATGDARERE